MRDRLIETIQNSVGGCARHWAEVIADGLIDSGVILPPCKVGDVVYYHGGIDGKLIKSAVIEKIVINDCGVCDLCIITQNGILLEDSVESFFFSREEAERALKGGAEC